LHEIVAREHAGDLLRQAQHERSLRAVCAVTQRSKGLYGSAMSWLGHWLIAWGWRLRARHGAIEL
jgi:predicted kinase